MKGFRRRLTFPVLCLAAGLVVFGVSYGMLGQGLVVGPEDDSEETGQVGGVDDPTSGGGELEEGEEPTPESPGAELPGGDEPVAEVSELFDVLLDSNVETLKQALEEGADPNATDDAGNNALHWAILGSRVSPVIHSKVSVLLTHGANPGATNNQGLTPLHFAAMYGGSDAVASALIEAGSPVNVVSEQQIGSPYELALKMGNDGVASAISRAPGHVSLDPKKESVLKSFGSYSNVLREGFQSARTSEELEGFVAEAVSRLVKSGAVDEAEATKIRKQLLERIKGNNCATCEEN